MEESSEKRWERLQRMRVDASSQSQFQSPPPPPPPPPLSNPLSNSCSNNTTPQPQRFDFYTDPIGAFSGSKRRNQENFSSPFYRHDAGPRNSQVCHQFQLNQSPSQGSWRSPIQHSPFSGNIRRTPPYYNPNPNPNPNYYNPSPDYNPSPNYNPGPNSWSQSCSNLSSPNSWSQSCSNLSSHNSWNQSCSNLSSPNFLPRGSPIPSPRFSRRPCYGGGRRQGHHTEPGHYYLKTMVKDPWRKLKPIVGNILVSRFGSSSWLPKSFATPKKVKMAVSGGKPQLSHAESLALSLEEVANDE